MNDTVITMIGRIVDVPKRRLTEAGVSVLNMRVGSTARRLDRETQKWVDGESLFLNVTCWRSLADNVARSLVQGDAVVIHGRVFTREYEHNGQRRNSYDVEAYAVGPDLTWARVEYIKTRRDPITHEVIDAVPEGDPSPGGAGADAVSVADRPQAATTDADSGAGADDDRDLVEAAR